MNQKAISSSEIQNLDKRFRTNLINSLTGFKSVALIGTQNKQGDTNLAVFSQIFHVGANPPLIGILFRPHSVERHTLENIEETGFLTINHIHRDIVKQAHHTSARWDQSEFEACHLTPEHTNLAAPYVQESHLKIGLKMVEKQMIKANDTELVISEILEIYAPEDIIGEDGFIDLEKAGTLTCSGLDSYHQTSKVARYTYAKPDHLPKEL